MKRTAKGIEQHKSIIQHLADSAAEQCVKVVDSSLIPHYPLLVSRLRTRVKCVRRGQSVYYSLAVPEINQSFLKTVATSTEFI
jgi:hypothetical protein